MKLNAKELRVSEPTEENLAKIKRREIYIICDNVLDTYNVGSIFRLADAVAAKRVYLCGQTETPPYHRISKAAVGTEKWVPWEYAATAVETITKLRGKFSTGSNNIPPNRHSGERGDSRIKRGRFWTRFWTSQNRCGQNDSNGIKVIVIEQNEKAVDFRKADYREPVAFVVGNETEGVSKEALAMADEIVEIPMWGVNRSLNVMVSLAIVLYRAVAATSD